MGSVRVSYTGPTPRAGIESINALRWFHRVSNSVEAETEGDCWGAMQAPRSRRVVVRQLAWNHNPAAREDCTRAVY